MAHGVAREAERGSPVRRTGKLRQLQWADYALLFGILGGLLVVILLGTLSVT